MYMHWLDWVIVAAFTSIVVGLTLFVKKYVRGVADFLAGNRLAGRYLLTVAGTMGASGAISVVAIWQSYYYSGWGATWWSVLLMPVTLIIALSGWVVYRYRQTRSLTLAQFFEKRYSRKFRVFAGLMAFLSGVINYAIFPSVAARLLLYVCGVPEYPVEIGAVTISLSYAVIMALMLGFALWITLRTGQVGIMVTDGIQGVILLFLTLVISVYLVSHCGWDRIGEALVNVPNADTASMVNPFKTSKVRDFNLWYYLIAIFGGFYGTMAWQGTCGYYAAAKSPHEMRMASILSMLRTLTTTMVMGGVCMAAYTVMKHPDFSNLAIAINERVLAIGNPAIQKQMTVPIAVGQLLPVGILGCFVAVIISLAVTTDDTYLLSWGSIFIQDVVLPFRKKELSQEDHIQWLRWSVVGVAVFAYFFSLFFRQTDFILMFFAITGAFFLAGAGSAIVGGLYWKRGTARGAWAAMIVGSTIALIAAVMQQLPFTRIEVAVDAPNAQTVMIGEEDAVLENGKWTAKVPVWRQEDWQSVRISVTDTAGELIDGGVFYSYGRNAPLQEQELIKVSEAFSALSITPAPNSLLLVPNTMSSKIFYAIRCINGQWMFLISMLAAICMYIIFSLSEGKVHNMDKLLHRKEYALEETADAAPLRGWKAVFRITEEFSLGDKFIYFFTSGWALGWMIVCLSLIAANLIRTRSDWVWVKYFEIYYYISITFGLILVVWYVTGAIRDMISLCRGLAVAERDAHDDGRVTEEEKG